MRAGLGFECTGARSSLDMAGDGSAVLFLDSLDSLTIEERLTVTDLLRRQPEFRHVRHRHRTPRFWHCGAKLVPADVVNQLGPPNLS